MPTISDAELLGLLNASRKAFLLEPPYRRKYLPLGLAKISKYLKARGTSVSFGRSASLARGSDAVFVTTLFTYDSEKVLAELNALKTVCPGVPVVVGGIYASLMSKHILDAHPEVMVFRGFSKELDAIGPDYDMDWQEEEDWKSYGFVFTTRGCPNRCPYCAVWRLEQEQWENADWARAIRDGSPNFMVSDNNLLAWPVNNLRSVIKVSWKRGLHLCFDNGFDCKLVTDAVAFILSKGRYVHSGVRFAFDRIAEDGVFQEAIRKVIRAGVSKGNITAFALFNFKDTPKEADYRLRECVNLGVRPYPQRYTPLNATDRKIPFVGKHWTPQLARMFRRFWLFAGINTKATFDDWRKTQDLSPEDHAAWEKEGPGEEESRDEQEQSAESVGNPGPERG